jgi:hypothetical protein
MKSPFKKLFAATLLFLATSASGQEEGERNGFINVVNMIPTTPACTVLIDSSDLMPGGLKSGTGSGWFSMSSRSVTLEIEAPGCEAASGSVDLPADSSQVVVIFLEPSTKKDSDGKPLPPAIKIKRFPSLEKSKGYSLALASTCEIETRFTIAKQSHTVPRFGTIPIPGWNGAGFSIAKDGKVIGSVTDPNEKGPYYLFISNSGDEYLTSLVSALPQALLKK